MNLDLYLKRIEFNHNFDVSFQTLTQLHQRHALSIPFENLDIQLGKPISLEIEALEKKLVEKKRGGYCFEQNTWMQAVLTELGFDVIACEARVRMSRSIVTPRTHMLLIVTLDQQKFLVDVGFGGDGLLLPVPLDGKAHQQFLWTYRVVNEGGLLVLQVLRSEGWLDHYAFTPEARHPIDFQVANWFTSTHPTSRFVQTLTVQLPTPEARYILRNRKLVIQRGMTEEAREISSRAELMDILDRTFGLQFPQATIFQNPQFEPE